MGPRASRWWIAYLLVFGAALLGAVMDRRWGSAALVAAILVAGLVTTAGSLLLQLAVHVVACAFAALSAEIAFAGGDLFWGAFGVLAALVLGALVPLALLAYRVDHRRRTRTLPASVPVAAAVS